jgi:uncharacterized lipoprotein YehR (DUF1307 family)
MKRLLSVILVVALALTMTFALVGCASGECDWCEETKSLSNFNFDGDTLKVCSECKSNLEALEALMNMFS